MFHFLALLTAVAAKAIDAVTGEPKPKVMPKFEAPIHFHPNRLDARPLIWLLENKPEEWSYPYARPISLDSPFLIRHGESEHEPNHDYVADLHESQLYRADCDCSHSSRRFQEGQSEQFHAAAKAWDAARQQAQAAG